MNCREAGSLEMSECFDVAGILTRPVLLQALGLRARRSDFEALTRTRKSNNK